VTETETAIPTFDFEGAEPWDVSTDNILPIGNYACEIVSASGGLNRNGNKEVQIEVSCAEGSRRDWLVYGTPNDTKGAGVSKVATLFRVAGVQLVNTDQEADGKLADAKVAQLVGKKVGVVVRKEKEEDKYPRVKGYVPVEAVQSVAPPTTSRPGPSDQDIPF